MAPVHGCYFPHNVPSGHPEAGRVYLLSRFIGCQTGFFITQTVRKIIIERHITGQTAVGFMRGAKPDHRQKWLVFDWFDFLMN